LKRGQIKRTPFRTKQTAQRSLKKQADILWSQVIRLRAKNTCEWCGRQSGVMNAHHLFNRSILHMRHNPENGMCLCVRCHVWDSRHSAHQTPELFGQFLFKEKGHEWYYKMIADSQRYQKPDYNMEILYLKDLLKHLRG